MIQANKQGHIVNERRTTDDEDKCSFISYYRIGNKYADSILKKIKYRKSL